MPTFSYLPWHLVKGESSGKNCARIVTHPLTCDAAVVHDFNNLAQVPDYTQAENTEQ